MPKLCINAFRFSSGKIPVFECSSLFYITVSQTLPFGLLTVLDDRQNKSL